MSSDITADVVDLSDITTSLDGCVDSLERSWQDNLNEAGSASISFLAGDPTLAVITPPNRLITFSLLGTPAFTMLCEQRQAKLIDPAEDYGQRTIWSGRGHLALLERAVVYPALPLGARPIEEDRQFNWTAVIYDDTGSPWAPPTMLCTVDDARTGSWADGTPETEWDTAGDFAHGAGPVIAPDGFGCTLDTAPTGDWYVRQSITTSFTGRHQLQVLMDNFGEVYWDGALVSSPGQSGDGTNGYRQVTKIDLDLTAGTHQLAIHVGNLGIPPSNVHDPTGLAFVLAKVDGNSVVTSLIAGADPATARVVGYPSEAPGMTPGAAILMMLDEARNGTTIGNTTRASGDPLAAVNLITTSFTATLDSKGLAWPVVADMATKVGTTLLTFLRELSATYIDFAMAPGTLVLDCYKSGDRKAFSGADYHGPTDPHDPTSGNLLSLIETAEA